MGLSSDLEQVFLDNLSDAGTESIEVDAKQKVKIKELSDGISNAIVNFLQKQTFTITDMKAAIQIENLSTTNPIIFNVAAPTGIVGTPAAVGAPVQIPQGAPVPLSKLDLGVGAQGGIIDTTAYAYLGKSTPSAAGEDNSDETSVKLVDVIGE